MTPKDPFTSSLVVDRLTGYHPNAGPIFGGTKRQHFAIRTAVNGPLSPQINPQEVRNCGASELLLTSRTGPSLAGTGGYGMSLVMQFLFGCGRSPISRVFFGMRPRVAMD